VCNKWLHNPNDLRNGQPFREVAMLNAHLEMLAGTSPVCTRVYTFVCAVTKYTCKMRCATSFVNVLDAACVRVQLLGELGCSGELPVTLKTAGAVAAKDAQRFVSFQNTI
jgi:hypothetical protein